MPPVGVHFKIAVVGQLKLAVVGQRTWTLVLIHFAQPLSAARGRQALEAVEARREELVALGARPPAMSQSALPPSVLPAEFELDEAAQVAANDPDLRPQYEELLARAYPEEEQRARVLAEEAERLAEDEVWRAAEEAAKVAWEARWAARVAARDRVKAKRTRAGLEFEKGAEPEEDSGLEQGLGPEGGFVPERESGPEEGAEPVEVPEPLPPRRVTLAERLWRPHVKRWLTKLAVDEWVRQKKRDMQGYDAMNVVRDGMVAEAARVLELSDDESTEGKAAKRVGGLLPQPEEADYALAGPLEEEEPYMEPWDAWDECDWRVYMEKRAARERRHALFRQVQVRRWPRLPAHFTRGRVPLWPQGCSACRGLTQVAEHLGCVADGEAALPCGACVD